MYEVGKIRKYQTTNYTIVYFFTMSYKVLHFLITKNIRHTLYCYIALH